MINNDLFNKDAARSGFGKRDKPESDPIPDVTKKVDVPNPGSKKAYELGCICPKDQPQAFQGLFWQVVGCPIHGKKEEATDEL